MPLEKWIQPHLMLALHLHTRTPPKRFHRFTLFVECTLHVRRCYRCRHCRHRRRHFSGCSSRFSYSIASNPFSFSLRKVGVKMHISARARSIDRMHIMTLINRDRVCEVSFFGYVHHRRECITFNIRLSVYSRRIVFVQKVCGINVEMSSAAAVAVNFLFSLFGTSNFSCGFWHILCRARWRKIVSSKHSMQLMYDVGDDDDDDWYTSRVDTCTIILPSHCVHFPQFCGGLSWALSECMCHKNLSSTFRIFAEARRYTCVSYKFDTLKIGK